MIIAVSNQKGGVGKSTTVDALGAGLTLRGYKVLYVDMDPQSNLSHSLGASGMAVTSMEVLSGTAKAEEAIISTKRGDIIPASPALVTADMTLKDTGREYLLREALMDVTDKYNYILIDTPLALGILTINALTAADEVLIPAQAEIYSLQGLGQLSQTISVVRKYCNPALKISGLLLTRYNARAILSRELTEMLASSAEELGTKLFDVKIRECQAVKDAAALRKSIFEYSIRSNAAADYDALIDELLKDKKRRKK